LVRSSAFQWPLAYRRGPSLQKIFTIWAFACVLIASLRCRIASKIRDHDSLGELDQILDDQLTPAIAARLHKQSTFGEPAQFDREETYILRERTNLRCGSVIVAR